VVQTGSYAYIYFVLFYPQNHQKTQIEKHKIMNSSLWICLILLLSFVYASFAANPRTPIDVPFGRNYVPTWAYDHIKYLNGGSEILLNLDKSTGICYYHF